ncbi:hypothetical protein MPSEU_000956000 [Mayamaea pseudoterrestris]|nr:hypothetical protein MPSEU_000956000 [Mayamaea pseudoterrestris]
MTEKPLVFEKHCVIGAPVSCLSFPLRKMCVYGQGGWLERRTLRCETTMRQPPTFGTKQDRVLVLEDGVIHGVRYSCSKELTAVFGGNQVSFLRNVLDLNRAMIKVTSIRRLDDANTAIDQQSKNILVVPDWIWDCQWQNDNGLVVGLAHNKIQLWKLDFECNMEFAMTAECLRQVCGQTKTISYCMHIYGDLVAVGLPLRDILVWSLKGDDENSRQEAILKGHHGCIHAVRFKHDNILASASDDRTIRLWECHDGEWRQRWTAWSHAARCWSVTFSSLGVVSTGEDGTARVWDEQSGAPLAVLRGHSCQSVWRVDALKSFVVTGANDGSVAVYDLRHQIRYPRKQVADHSSCSWSDTVMIPNTSVAGTCLANFDDDEKNGLDSEVKTKSKSKPKEKLHALVGMQFVRQNGRAPQLLVATRHGEILRVTPELGELQQISKWWDLSLREFNVNATDGSCFSVCPSGANASIGTINGEILLIDLFSYGLGDNLILLKSVAVPSFTGLDRLWYAPCSDGDFDLIVGGYYANTYAVVNTATGYEVFRSDTGGRQRINCIDFKVLSNNYETPASSTTNIWFAVSGANVDGCKKIELSRNEILGQGYSWNTSSAPRMHGDVIFDCCLFALNQDTIALVTASEDCYSRITCIRNKVVIASELLPAQAGGARALCQTRFDDEKTLLAIGGAKLELQFYFVHDQPLEAKWGPVVEFVGVGKSFDKATIDHRINALAALALSGRFSTGAAIAAGDSNGKVYLYSLSKNRRGPLIGRLVFAGERPVLSLALVQTTSLILLMVGNTGGQITVLDVSESLQAPNSVADIANILLSYDAHQVGTNAITARTVIDASGHPVIRYWTRLADLQFKRDGLSMLNAVYPQSVVWRGRTTTVLCLVGTIVD